MDDSRLNTEEQWAVRKMEYERLQATAALAAEQQLALEAAEEEAGKKLSKKPKGGTSDRTGRKGKKGGDESADPDAPLIDNRFTDVQIIWLSELSIIRSQVQLAEIREQGALPAALGCSSIQAKLPLGWEWS